MILQLVNSKGRVVFAAQDDGTLITKAWWMDQQTRRMFSVCRLHPGDNPSCEVSGDYAEQFINYCQEADLDV